MVKKELINTLASTIVRGFAQANTCTHKYHYHARIGTEDRRQLDHFYMYKVNPLQIMVYLLLFATVHMHDSLTQI